MTTYKFLKPIIVSIISILILSVLFIFLLNQNKTEPTQVQNTATNISLGIQMSPAMALPMIAKEKGYFTNNNLNVDIKEFAAGKDALTAFLSGSLDFSISGEVPANLAILNGNSNFIVPAQVVNKTVNEVRVVATNVEIGYGGRADWTFGSADGADRARK